MAAETVQKTSTTKSPQMAYYINSFITVLLMVGIGFLPAPDPITPMGMKIVGIDRKSVV